MTRMSWATVIAFSLCTAAAACSSSDGNATPTPPDTTTPPPGSITLGLQPVASGLAFPLLLTAPPGDPRLFVVEKGGRIRIVKGGTLLPAPTATP